MCVIYIQTETPVCDMQHFPNEPICSKCSKLQSKPASQPISELCASTRGFDLHNYSRWNGFK